MAAAIASVLSMAPLPAYADAGYIADVSLTQGNVQDPAANGAVPNAGQAVGNVTNVTAEQLSFGHPHGVNCTCQPD